MPSFAKASEGLRQPQRDDCRGKKRHRNRAGALIHIRKLQEPGMHPYRCSKRRFWHIGHSNRADGIQSKLDRLIGPDPRTQDNNGKPLPTTANHRKLPPP